MVYKKYIKRDGKIFGPYYFKSVRDKNGKVKSVYLGTENPTKRSLPTLSLAVLLVLFLVLGTFGFFAYQGFQIAEVVESLEEERVEEIDIVEEDLEGKLGEEVEIEEILEEEPDIVIENESSELEIEINESLVVNETEINESETLEENSSYVVENDSEEISIEDNISVEGNSNQENETIEDVIEEPMFEEDIQSDISLRNLGVVINQPVIWEKNLRLSETLEDYSVHVPTGAFDVEVYEIVENEEILIFEEIREDMNLITGNVVFDFFEGLFGFTGNVVLEKETVTLKKAPKEFLIRYSTEGPRANESIIDASRKKMVVEGEEFEDVLVYSYLDNVPVGSAKIYHAGEEIEVVEKDLDEDGLIDYIEWKLLKLNGKDEFEISIIVLNVQSYPAVGGNWTVEFNTTGTADLKIRPINGTTWSLDNESGVDMQFLDLRCGEKSLDYLWVNDSVLVENYSCEDIGYEISMIFTDDKHYLEFDFGGQKAYAKNDVLSCGDVISSSGTVVLENDLIGCTGTGVEINADHVDFNCDGHTIAGNGDTGNYAVYINYEDNVTVRNCLLRNFSDGVIITGDDTEVINNTIMNIFDTGVYAYDGDNMNITNNTIKDYQSGGSARGVYRKYFDNSEISNNIFTNLTDGSSGVGIHLDRTEATCSGNNIFGNVMTGARWGFFVSECSDMDIYNNTAYDNGENGIYIYGNNTRLTVRDNIIYTTAGSQNTGIFITNTTVVGDEPTNNSIRNNIIYDHTATAGIYLRGGLANDNNITNNTIYENLYGIYLRDTSKNLIEGNEIYDNLDRGILLNYDSENNTILNNSFYNTNGASPEMLYGIRLEGTYRNEIKYNTFKNFTTSSTMGIRMANDDCDYNVIENNSFIQNYYPIWNQGGDYNNISYNNFSSDITGSRGPTTDGSDGAKENRFVNNKFTTTTESGSTYGYYLRYCHNCTLLDHNIPDTHDYSAYIRNTEGVNVTNFTANDAAFYNLYLNGANGTFDQLTLSLSTYGLGMVSSTGALFKDSVINGTSYGVLFHTNTDNIRFVDSFLYAPTYGMRELTGTGWKKSTLLNTTYNGNILYASRGTGVLEFQQYLDVRVNTTTGDGIENANVTVFNTSSGFVLENLTNSSGWILRQNVTSHFGNYTVRYFDSPNNHTVNVTHSTYGTNTTIINISGPIMHVVTYAPLSDPTDYVPLRNTSIESAIVAWVSNNDSAYETPESKKNFLNKFAITNDSGTNWYTGFVTKNLSEYSEESSTHEPQMAFNKEGYGVLSGKQGANLLYAHVWDYNYSSGKWFSRDGGLLFYTDSTSSPTVDIFNNDSMMVAPYNSEGVAPYFSNSSDRGGIWGTWAETNNTYNAEADFRISAFTYLSDGDGLLVFLDVDNNVYQSYRWYNDTGVWGYEGEVANSSTAGTQISHGDITAYPGGGAYFVWANTSSSEDPVYSRYYDGDEWSTTALIDGSSNYFYLNRPVVSCGEEERCLAIWPDTVNGLEYAYLEGGISKPSWSAQNQNVGGGIWGEAVFKNRSNYEIAVDSVGNALLCYIDSADQKLKTTRFLWSMKLWSNPAIVTTDVNNFTARGDGTGCDIKLFDNSTNPLEPPTNSAPVLDGILVEEQKVGSSETQTVNPFSLSPPAVSDGDNDILQFVCCVDESDSCTPSLALNNCTGSGHSNVGPAGDYSGMDCAFTVEEGPATKFVRCATYDLEDYSTIRSDSYTINARPDSLTPNLEGAGGTNRTHELLNCTGNLTDFDGDPMNVTVTWSNQTLGGSEFLQHVKYNESYPNGTMFNATYDSNGTRWGDVYVCNIAVEDAWNSAPGGPASNQMNITNTPPERPTLLTPTNKNTTVFDRTPLFNWTNSTDVDVAEGREQTIVYNVSANYGDFGEGLNPVFYLPTGNGGLDDYYIPSNPIDVDTDVYWFVDVSDGYDANESVVWNFTIESRLDIVLTSDEVAFGSMAIGENDNTTDKDPTPFVMENQGNVIMDVNLSATELFSTSGLGNSSYQFKIDESEADSFNTTGSVMDWAFMPTGMILAVDSLYYESVNDTAECHINITIPPYEPAGDAKSSVTFTSIIGE